MTSVMFENKCLSPSKEATISNNSHGLTTGVSGVGHSHSNNINTSSSGTANNTFNMTNTNNSSSSSSPSSLLINSGSGGDSGNNCPSNLLTNTGGISISTIASINSSNNISANVTSPNSNNSSGSGIGENPTTITTASAGTILSSDPISVHPTVQSSSTGHYHHQPHQHYLDHQNSDLLSGLPDHHVCLSEKDLQEASKDTLIDVYHQLQRYIDLIQQKHHDEILQMRDTEEKLRLQQIESSRRENVLVMRLTTKEQEMHEYALQLAQLKSSIAPTGALRSSLLDPAVNLIILKMKKELEDTKKKLEDTQNDLNAWKFTPDSNTGKRLMAKCRMLYQENEDLGKMISSGRLAKLESDLALQRSLTEELKKAQSEMDEVVQELDEDIDGMQGTLCFWQDQLKQYKQQNSGNPLMNPCPSPTLPTHRHQHHSHSHSHRPPKECKLDPDLVIDMDNTATNSNVNVSNDSPTSAINNDSATHSLVERRERKRERENGSGSNDNDDSGDNFNATRNSEPPSLTITTTSSSSSAVINNNSSNNAVINHGNENDPSPSTNTKNSGSEFIENEPTKCVQPSQCNNTSTTEKDPPAIVSNVSRNLDTDEDMDALSEGETYD